MLRMMGSEVRTAHNSLEVVHAATFNPEIILFDFGLPRRNGFDATRRIWEQAALKGERAFDRLPILVDALEGGGCDDQSILNHYRSEEPHGEGCWLVDLLPSKK